MEGQVWVIVEELLSLVEGRPARCRHSDGDILRVSLWAILHDRPMSWACREENWPTKLRPSRLPDDSTVSRRWQRPELQHKASLLHELGVRRFGENSRYAIVDGRPLPVGGCTKDPDARPGRSAGGMGIGYKMHALVSLRHVILSYEIRPMNEAEPTVALQLIEGMPEAITRVLGDGVYDSMNLHRRVASVGKKLYAPIRQGRVGRRQQPRRLQLLRLWRRAIGRKLEKARDEVERTFGQESNVAFGFKGLPAWARRSRRVDRWMWGKNLLHNAWLLTKTNAA
jgi:hypothetical protein